MVYEDVKDNGFSCAITGYVSNDPDVSVSLTSLIINEVPAFDQVNYYFCNPELTRCILASNSQMGVTGTMYRYNSTTHEMTQLAVQFHPDSSTPSDYYDTIKSGDFEIRVVQ